MQALITYELVVLPAEETPETPPTGGTEIVTPAIS
jgi:hypothetical protein